jgi:hypothetical protein
MPRASTSIGLVLIGTTLSAMGFDAYQARKSMNNVDDMADTRKNSESRAVPNRTAVPANSVPSYD